MEADRQADLEHWLDPLPKRLGNKTQWWMCPATITSALASGTVCRWKPRYGNKPMANSRRPLILLCSTGRASFGNSGFSYFHPRHASIRINADRSNFGEPCFGRKRWRKHCLPHSKVMPRLTRQCEDGGKHGVGWRSFAAVEYATLKWVDWFNHRRLLEPIGNIPPAEVEELYYAMLDDVSMAA